jgi:hypothetical protein
MNKATKYSVPEAGTQRYQGLTGKGTLRERNQKETCRAGTHDTSTCPNPSLSEPGQAISKGHPRQDQPRLVLTHH